MHKHVRALALTLAIGMAAGLATTAEARPNDTCARVAHFLQEYQPGVYTIGFGIMFGLQDWYGDNCLP